MKEEIKAAAAKIGLERGEKQKQLVMDYHVTFATEAGQRVLDDISKITGYESIIGAPPKGMAVDADRILMETGMRNVFIHILKKLKQQG